MRKSTFCKIIYRIRKLNSISEGIRNSYIEDVVRMLLQDLEEDTGCVWKQSYKEDILKGEKPAEDIYDEVMNYSYQHCCNYGIRLQEMLYSGAVDHNALVGIWEEDEKEPHYSNRVWKGMFWELPEEYRERIGQVHSIVADNVSESDIVNIELRKKPCEDA